MIIRGFFHAHSLYSRDGKLSLEGLAELLRERNLHCVFLSEHYEDLGEARIKRFIEEVDLINGSSDVVLIPGLEIDFGDVHIIAFGLNQYIEFSNMNAFFDYSRDENLFTILAHPTKIREKRTLEYCIERTDGFEIWNSRSDGSSIDYRFLKSLRYFDGIDSKVKIYGLDLHDARDFRMAPVIFDIPKADADSILYALKMGSFCNSMEGFGLFESKETLETLLAAIGPKAKAKFFLILSMRYIASKVYRILSHIVGKRKLEGLKDAVKRRL